MDISMVNSTAVLKIHLFIYFVVYIMVVDCWIDSLTWICKRRQVYKQMTHNLATVPW